MKWLYLLLCLAVLFAFAMPVVSADTGPPGDVVIEQAMTNPPDPVITLAKEYPFGPALESVIRTGTLDSMETPQYLNVTAATDNAYLRLWRTERMMVRFTFNQAALLQPEGGWLTSQPGKPVWIRA